MPVRRSDTSAEEAPPDPSPSGRAPVLTARTRVPPAAGLVRDRLADLLGQVWSRRLAVVVAPAGAGKTTLLAQFAATSGGRVAWYRADAADAGAATVLRYLEAALADALPGLPRGAEHVDELVEAVDAARQGRVLLVVDDLHALVGTEGERVVARLTELAPPGFGVVAASRTPPGFPLSRRRVTGDLVEVDRDDLRFRSWEVERLFRDVYREPLAPVDLAVLARRTDGWAAGLQLFHLATRDRRPDERRRVLDSLDGRWRLLREYLTDNLLDQLPADLRAFLIETSPSPVLSGPLCDAMLGREDSAAVLAELERRQLFTDALEDGWYRYHEVLRGHLESVLVERDGDDLVRRRHARAAALLEAAGRPADAVAAYCRAEDYDAVARLLGQVGATIANDSGAWLDRLPTTLLRDDPWVLLATARRHRAHGRWQRAITTYRAAERRLPSAAAADVARRERVALTVWAGPAFERRGDLAGVVRAAVTRDPLAALDAGSGLRGVDRLLATGAGAVLAGHAGAARAALDAVLGDPSATPLHAVTARLLAALAGLLGGDASAVLDVDRAQREAERIGQPWLARIAGAVAGLSDVPGSDRRAATVAAEAAARDDRWGAALARLLGGLGGVLRGMSADAAALDALAADLVDLDAGTLAAWAASAAALARAQVADPGAAVAAVTAAARARAVAADGPELLALRALGMADPPRAATSRERIAGLQTVCGLALAPDAGGDRAGAPLGGAGTTLRLFGGLALSLGGAAVDLDALRPRAKRVLRMLAAHVGRPVHRETVVREMWPEADPDTAMRNLHVVLSQLRTALEPEAERGTWSLLVRDGDSYRLQLPPGAQVDLLEFDAAVAAGRAAGRADDAAAVRAFERALDLHSDELLPEEGPAEWVLAERERCRAEASDAAQRLAELHAAAGDHRAAVRACVRGLRIDRYRDVLWRTLADLHERAGDRAAAAQTRRRYAALLAELGIDADDRP